MNKNILVISYSQTGQLHRVLESVLVPLKASDEVVIHHHILKPIPPYPFPWPLLKFFSIFPETVALEPPELEPLTIEETSDYDLVILAYQVWYLSPSLPTTAFLKSPQAKILKNKPVVTLIGCRNMWIMAQQTVQRLIKDVGGYLIDNIVLTDQGSSVGTFITTPRWMFTGKKDAFLSFFKPAGISDQDIKGAERFGHALVAGLAPDKEPPKEPLLKGLKAVEVDPKLYLTEKVAYRAFKVWSKLIRAISKPETVRRNLALSVFIGYLIIMIIVIVPISALIKTVLLRVRRGYFETLKQYYEQPSGSGAYRL